MSQRPAALYVCPAAHQEFNNFLTTCGVTPTTPVPYSHGYASGVRQAQHLFEADLLQLLLVNEEKRNYRMFMASINPAFAALLHHGLDPKILQDPDKLVSGVSSSAPPPPSGWPS